MRSLPRVHHGQASTRHLFPPAPCSTTALWWQLQARLTLYQASSWDHQTATRAPRTSWPATLPGESPEPLLQAPGSPRGVELPLPPPRPRPDPSLDDFAGGLVRRLCSSLCGVAGPLVGTLGEQTGVWS